MYIVWSSGGIQKGRKNWPRGIRACLKLGGQDSWMYLMRGTLRSKARTKMHGHISPKIEQKGMESAWLARTEASLPNGFMDHCISLVGVHMTWLQQHPGKNSVKRQWTLLLEIWNLGDLFRKKNTRRRGRGDNRDAGRWIWSKYITYMYKNIMKHCFIWWMYINLKNTRKRGMDLEINMIFTLYSGKTNCFSLINF